MEKLVKRIEELEALLAVALSRIVELEEQLWQNSRNSSKSPSSDMGRRKVPKETTGRKPGGQPGHPGTMRDPVPQDQVGEVVDLDPETCANCGTRLEAAPRLDADIRHAHLRRHFQAMLESSGETATQGAMLKLASDRTFHWWHAFERDEIDQAELVRRMDPIQKETHQRLTILRDDPTVQKKARGIAKDLLRQWEAIWTFVTEDAAVPTNNEAYAACGIMKPSLPCARPSFGGRGASASTAKPAPGSWSAS